MTRDDVSFDAWFDHLCLLLEDAGIQFSDEDSVRADYEDGLSTFDVVDDIRAEYEA